MGQIQASYTLAIHYTVQSVIEALVAGSAPVGRHLINQSVIETACLYKFL